MMAGELSLFIGTFVIASIIMLLNLILAEWFFYDKFKHNKDFKSAFYEILGNIGIVPILAIIAIMLIGFIVSIITSMEGYRYFFFYVVIYYVTMTYILTGKIYKSEKRHRWEN